MPRRSAMLAWITIVSVASASLAQPRAPSREALASAVRRFVAPDASVDACRALGVERGELQYACRAERCEAACQSAIVVVVLGFRGSRVRVVSRDSRRGADTGRCGCCMSLE